MKTKEMLLAVWAIIIINLVNGKWEEFRNKILCTTDQSRHICIDRNSNESSSTLPSLPELKVIKSEEEEKRKNVEVKIFESIYNGVCDEVLKQVKNLTGFNKDVEFNAPYLIKRNYSHKELVNYSQKWNWNDEYDTILEIETNQNEDFSKIFSKTLDDSVELAVQNKLTNEITNEKVKTIASVIISNVPRRCEINENINKVETIFYELCKSNQKFEIDKFKIKLMSTIDNQGYSNLNLSEPEIEELSIMILSTSNELDRILNRIQNEVRENVIKSMQSLVISILKANHSSYFDMMDQVNKKISSIYDFQSTEQNVRSKFESTIRLSYITRKIPKDPFIFSIKSIIGDRFDSDFFEFVPMNRLNPDNSSFSANEGKINVSPLSISGIAPAQNIEHSYSLTLIYTYLKDGSKQTIPVWVSIAFCNQFDKCEKQNKSQENIPNLNTNVIIIVVILALISIIGALFAIWKMRSRKINVQHGQFETSHELNQVRSQSYASI